MTLGAHDEMIENRIYSKNYWNSLFENESRVLKSILGDRILHIDHIGSTSVENIYTRPILDILLTVNNTYELIDMEGILRKKLQTVVEKKSRLQYEYTYINSNNQHIYLYLLTKDNVNIQRYIGFKKTLQKSLEQTQAYSTLKYILAQAFHDNLQLYKIAKDSFIRKIEYDARVAEKRQLKASDDINICPYNDSWPKLANAEIKTILEFVNLPVIDIQHVGSTAIQGLAAKPILDIFIAIKDINFATRWRKKLEALSYVYWADNPNKTHHRYFKGMPPFGLQRTHHLHILPPNEEYYRTIKFRDILRKNTELKNQYYDLKKYLMSQYQCDREAYTHSKSKFINRVLDRN